MFRVFFFKEEWEETKLTLLHKDSGQTAGVTVRAVAIDDKVLSTFFFFLSCILFGAGSTSSRSCCGG